MLDVYVASGDVPGYTYGILQAGYNLPAWILMEDIVKICLKMTPPAKAAAVENSDGKVHGETAPYSRYHLVSSQFCSSDDTSGVLHASFTGAGRVVQTAPLRPPTNCRGAREIHLPIGSTVLLSSAEQTGPKIAKWEQVGRAGPVTIPVLRLRAASWLDGLPGTAACFWKGD